MSARSTPAAERIPLDAAPAMGALTRGSDVTLAEQLAWHFSQRIGARLMTAGGRLPSVRECARRHGVSPHTVVAAYDLLLARGLVEARRHRGFYVREQDPSRAQAGLAAAASSHTDTAVAAPAHRPRVVPVDATALIRGMFHHNSQLPAPGLGTLPPQWLD